MTNVKRWRVCILASGSAEAGDEGAAVGGADKDSVTGKGKCKGEGEGEGESGDVTDMDVEDRSQLTVDDEGRRQDESGSTAAEALPTFLLDRPSLGSNATQVGRGLGHTGLHRITCVGQQ